MNTNPIRFGPAAATPIRPEVLNHPTDSPIKDNQIQFRMGGAYLTKFDSKSIEAFLDKQPNGNKLDRHEVQTFIQRVAENATQVQGMTFDLSDPEIGLYKNDDIKQSHLAAPFSLNIKVDQTLSGGARQDVRFVDVTSVSFELKEKEATQTQLRDLRKQLGDEQKDQATINRVMNTFLEGDNAQTRLTEALERRGSLEAQIQEIDNDLSRYQTELQSPELAPARKTELERMITGATAEKGTLNTELRQLKENMDKKTGYPLQRYSLNQLHAQNQKVERLSAQVTELEASLRSLNEGLTRPNDSPAAAPANAATEPATQVSTPADADEDEVEIQVGQSADLDAIKDLGPRQQAEKLAFMPEAEQKQLLQALAPEARQAIETEARQFIERSQSTSSTRIQQNVAAYQTLVNNLAALETAPAAERPAADDAETTVPAGGAAQPAGPRPPAQPPAADTAIVNEVASGAASSQRPASQPAASASGVSTTKMEPVPEGALTRKGEVMTYQGEVLTAASFSELKDLNAKFDVLMKCDRAHLRSLLTTLSPEERSAVKGLAQGVLDRAASQNAGNTVHIGDGKAHFVNASGERVEFRTTTGEYASAESRERAREIIQIIREIETHEARLSTDGYSVKPGDTARSIAESQLGSPFRLNEIFDRNPGLKEAMQAKGVTDLYSEDISKYPEFSKIKLTPSAPLANPVQEAYQRRAAEAEAARRREEEQAAAAVAAQPPVNGVADQPDPRPTAGAPVKTE